MGRHLNKLRITAPRFLNNTVLRQLINHAFWIGAFFIHLVNRDHDRHAGCSCMRYRFDRLRHNPIIGGDHQDNNIGRLGATGTHGGKGRVSWCVQEGNHAAGRFHMVGTNMLSNTA